ncbi:hypothetical protein [Streptomyces sp. NPDC020917]|uniref:hypothetical protein n=1 Tax=Streptomyces sp. NPDC020917 TaxID=3365102 RepID=UPI0037A867A9
MPNGDHALTFIAYRSHHHSYGHSHGGSGGLGATGLFVLLAVAAVIAIIVFAVKRSSGG